MTVARQALGAAGEEQAARWYRRRGYRILDRNWRCRQGELDLVVSWRRTVVFVEVKTRSSVAFGHPGDAVGPAKQRRIRQLAVAWLRANDARAAAMRFDVVAIVAGEIEVIEAAF